VTARPTKSVRQAAADGYVLASRLFLKALALIYLAAFVSLGVQVTALAGAGGIFPLAEQLSGVQGGSWLARLLAYPSLFWLASGDAALEAACWIGAGAAVLLLLGRWERPLLVLLFVLYLSLFHAGQLFMNFQWDYLLLEAGFLAIFLPGRGRVVIWLFRWLLFRLRFLSGVSKLVSGDAAWSGFTALESYFETQPLPHLGAWYAHHLPDWLLRFGTGATLFVELLVPFFFFLPRRWRLAGAGVTILWQVLIIATSNHNFFNLLTIALCLFLLDDRAVAALMPRGLAARWLDAGAAEKTGVTAVYGAVAAGAIVVPVSLALALEMVVNQPLPEPVAQAVEAVRPFRIANRYHVFPTVDAERYELQIEGTADGEHWETYRFRYKPGDPADAPPFVVPHQPRIDWLMWFVPKNPVFLPWFDRFLDRLLVNDPTVVGRLVHNPFPTTGPRALRVSIYRYRFSTPAERAATGHWWVRESLGPFLPLPGRQRQAG
jgi:hypothetical protein